MATPLGGNRDHMGRKAIRVGVVVPTREGLRRKALGFAADPRFPFERPQDFLRSYIRSREADIAKQREELGKVRRRIERHTECKRLAQNLIREFDEPPGQRLEQTASPAMSTLRDRFDATRWRGGR